MAGSFDLKSASNGQFHFVLKAGNGQTILSSQMYATKSSAETGIASVQENCSNSARYNSEVSANGKFFFTLKAANNHVIGNSQMYESAASRDAGIESVKTNGVSTTINDLT